LRHDRPVATGVRPVPLLTDCRSREAAALRSRDRRTDGRGVLPVGRWPLLAQESVAFMPGVCPRWWGLVPRPYRRERLAT
jgi:hypothetical protein